MTRHVLTIDLRDGPDVLQAYKEYHRNIWPEVVRSFRKVGVHEMEIYLQGRRLVLLVETDDGVDFQRRMAAHVASDPKCAEWEALMKTLQQPPPDAKPGEWWARMEPLFRLNGQ